MIEIWKDIKGYEGIYKISSLGKIISLKRKGVTSHRLLKLTTHRGYVSGVLSKDSVVNYFILSRLLYSHFKGDLVEGMVIDHIDNNPKNNSLYNLQQITIRENASKDRFRHNSTSNYLGVSWDNTKNKWRSTIYDGEKRKHIGYYIDEIKASEAYQEELKKIL